MIMRVLSVVSLSLYHKLCFNFKTKQRSCTSEMKLNNIGNIEPVLQLELGNLKIWPASGPKIMMTIRVLSVVTLFIFNKLCFIFKNYERSCASGMKLNHFMKYWASLTIRTRKSWGQSLCSYIISYTLFLQINNGAVPQRWN